MPGRAEASTLVGMSTEPDSATGSTGAPTAAHPTPERPAAQPYDPRGPQPPSQPIQPPRDVRMRRSTTDKMLLGVCGGIAEHTDIDPVYIRLAFLVSLFWGGIGIFGYIAAALVMPKPLS